jgi:hypothetical protein
MSGTNVYTSSVTGILYRDSISYQFAWTGTPSGNFDVQGSIDYNAGLPESAGSLNAGTWTSIPLTPVATITGSGGASNVLANLFDLAFPYTRFQYTNSTGSGVLGSWVSGKSFG